MILSHFDLRQKKNICKFRLRFCKSVQTFHAKVVCPTFGDRPPSEAAIKGELLGYAGDKVTIVAGESELTLALSVTTFVKLHFDF